MRAIIYLFTSIILLTAASCQNETTEPIVEQGSNVTKSLLGKWKFESLSGGLTGVKYVAVPSQVDVIEFKGDHTFIRTTNNEFVAQGTYEVYQSVSIFSQKSEYTLRYTPQHGQPSIISIVGDTLLLSENVADGFNIEYSRVK